MASLSELALSVGSIRVQRISRPKMGGEGSYVRSNVEIPETRRGERQSVLTAAGPVAGSFAVSKSAVALQESELASLKDGQLLQLFQSGNEPAFYVLFERRHKEIFTHCFRMCSGDTEKANDAFQDTFMKVFTRSDLFTDDTNGRAWLYRIATNTCLNQIRYDKRHPREALDATIGSIDPRMQPDFGSEQDSLRSALESAVAKLPIDLREAFLLRELEEFSYEEVAEQLGLTIAACRQRVYRAKQLLREELEEIVSGEPPKKNKSWLPFSSGRKK